MDFGHLGYGKGAVFSAGEAFPFFFFFSSSYFILLSPTTSLSLFIKAFLIFSLPK